LVIRTDDARHGEKNDRDEDENTQHQTEGIEEVGIGGFKLGHGNSLIFCGNAPKGRAQYNDSCRITE
jgi:hypothetical protein